MPWKQELLPKYTKAYNICINLYNILVSTVKQVDKEVKYAKTINPSVTLWQKHKVATQLEAVQMKPRIFLGECTSQKDTSGT